MPASQLKHVIHTLHRAAIPHAASGPTDGELLESYLAGREEAALAELVYRHGPMVWAVCRRLLRCHHDVEDAFQATFLVLVRKAGSIVPREKVANWLYGVAHQTALYARATLARRSNREKQVTSMPDPVIEQQDAIADLQALLDLELSRLPEKYRAVVVSCDLEGKTRKEAARHLQLPEGTVASRLATARNMLAKRLSRRGLAVSGATLAAALSQDARACVPASVTSSTIKTATHFAAGKATAAGAISLSAVALAEGVIKTMLLNKLKIASALLTVVAVLGTTAAVLVQQVLASKSATQTSQLRERAPEKPTVADRPAAAPEKRPATEEKDNEALPRIVTGVVKSVDAEKKTLAVTQKESEATFSLANDAHVSIDCSAGMLSSVPVGANVVLSQFVDRRTARAVSASGRSVFARVKEVNAENGTITIAGSDDDGQSFRVTKDTIVVIDGKRSTLAGIPTGAQLHALNLCVDQKTAHSINVDGPGFHGVPVKSVDAENKTITFDDKAPAMLAGKTLPVSSDADVRIDGKPGKLADVPAGSFVNLGLTVDSKTARILQVEGPHLGECGGSMVKSIDPVNSRITFDDSAHATIAGRTFVVAKDADVLIDGKPGKLSELPAGAFANVVLSVDRKQALRVHAQGPRLSGIVKAVDAQKNSITVDDRDFVVAKDAVVAIGDKRGSLASLATGVTVSLSLWVDQKTVGMIQTKSP
jgi:RNA polymerase sigma factor (sigma-70 family)